MECYVGYTVGGAIKQTFTGGLCFTACGSCDAFPAVRDCLKDQMVAYYNWTASAVTNRTTTAGYRYLDYNECNGNACNDPASDFCKTRVSSSGKYTTSEAVLLFAVLPIAASLLFFLGAYILYNKFAAKKPEPAADSEAVAKHGSWSVTRLDKL